MSDEAAARVDDDHICPGATAAGPHGGGLILAPGAATVIIGDKPAGRLAELLLCQVGAAPNDVIFGGAATVLALDLPLARVLLDATAHGGKVLPPGCPTVRIGGPAFALPPNIEIVGSADYQNKVIRDLYLLWTTPSGKEVFARLAAANQSVIIAGGASNQHFDVSVVGRSWVTFDPDEVSGRWLEPGPKAGPSVPAVSLAHELIHAMHGAEGTRYPHSVMDPNPPPSQPLIGREESATIGVGSHRNDRPTENTVRRELGLPARANHYGPPMNGPAGPTLRPGG